MHLGDIFLGINKVKLSFCKAIKEYKGQIYNDRVYKVVVKIIYYS